jgi:hypothetical protein
VILLPPGVQFKSIEGHALAADTHFCEIRADFGIEEIAIHAEIARGIPES